MPAGQGGVITLTFAPTSVYHAGIIGSGIALLILLGLALGIGRVRFRRPGLPERVRLDPAQPDPPAAVLPQLAGLASHLAPVSWRRALVTAIPVAVVVVVAGGPVAIAVPVLAIINNWRARWLPVIAACAMLTAGVVAATARTPNALGSGPFSGPAQACALVALAAALMPVISAKARGSAPSSVPGEALRRRPFTVPDEMACHFETQAEPFNIHLEMRIAGRLDREAFHAAAVAALIASPHASGRRAPHGLLSASYVWEHPATLDLDPVSFIDLADDADLARERAAFMSRSPSVDASPPVSLLVASMSDYDFVLLNGHHAAMDALSWLDLLRDIGRRYRGAGTEPGPGALDPPAALADAPQHAGRPGTPAPIRLASSARLSQRWQRLTRPARIARDGNGGRGYGLHLMPLTEVPAVQPFATGEKATLNEALITALIAAIGRWNAAHRRPARLIRITTPVNARDPGDIHAAGNLSRLVTIAAAPPAAGEDLMPLLLDVAHQARSARQRPGHQVGAGIRMLAALHCPAVVKRLTVHAALRTAGPLLCDSAMLTNLGNVQDPPDFGIDGPTIMAFSAQAQMPRGLSVAAITVGGQLQLALRYSRALFDQGATELFGTTLLSAFSEITTGQDVLKEK